jgi:hypothetical protein
MVLPRFDTPPVLGRSSLALLVSLTLSCVFAACASGPEAGVRPACASVSREVDIDPPQEQGATRIVAIHRSKCGSCHTPVQPGSLARSEAESAMGRHHRRVKLTDQEWAGMVDYLTGEGVKHAGTTAVLH